MILLSIIVFILLLGVLVFVHELGHFVVAKWTGMRVDEFALGFPPRLFGVKRGDTTYAINALPLGGYVRIHGEGADADQEPDERAFPNRPIWTRIVTIIAGVFMNLLFAFLVLTIAFSIGFYAPDPGLATSPGATLLSSQVMISGIQKDSPADRAGLQPGDIVQSVKAGDLSEAKTLTTLQELQTYTKQEQNRGEDQLQINYQRDGQDGQVTATINKTGAALGVYIDAMSVVRLPIWRSAVVAVQEIWAIITLTWQALGQFVHTLFYHAKLDGTVSGPVGIYQAASSATRTGAMAVIFLAVELSVNLALLNILPFPPLDGGKLFFLLVELMFRRRVIRHEIEAGITYAGVAILFCLIVAVSINDIIHLF